MANTNESLPVLPAIESVGSILASDALLPPPPSASLLKEKTLAAATSSLINSVDQTLFNNCVEDSNYDKFSSHDGVESENCNNVESVLLNSHNLSNNISESDFREDGNPPVPSPKENLLTSSLLNSNHVDPLIDLSYGPLANKPLQNSIGQTKNHSCSDAVAHDLNPSSSSDPHHTLKNSASIPSDEMVCSSSNGTTLATASEMVHQELEKCKDLEVPSMDIDIELNGNKLLVFGDEIQKGSQSTELINVNKNNITPTVESDANFPPEKTDESFLEIDKVGQSMCIDEINLVMNEIRQSSQANKNSKNTVNVIDSKELPNTIKESDCLPEASIKSSGNFKYDPILPIIDDSTNLSCMPPAKPKESSNVSMHVHHKEIKSKSDKTTNIPVNVNQNETMAEIVSDNSYSDPQCSQEAPVKILSDNSDPQCSQEAPVKIVSENSDPQCSQEAPVKIVSDNSDPQCSQEAPVKIVSDKSDPQCSQEAPVKIVSDNSDPQCSQEAPVKMENFQSITATESIENKILDKFKCNKNEAKLFEFDVKKPAIADNNSYTDNKPDQCPVVLQCNKSSVIEDIPKNINNDEVGGNNIMKPNKELLASSLLDESLISDSEYTDFDNKNSSPKLHLHENSKLGQELNKSNTGTESVEAINDNFSNPDLSDTATNEMETATYSTEIRISPDDVSIAEPVDQGLCGSPVDSVVLQTVVGGVLQTLDMSSLSTSSVAQDDALAEPIDNSTLFSGAEEIANGGTALHVLENSADEVDGIGGLVINSVVGAFGEAVDEPMDSEKELADISGGVPYLDTSSTKEDDMPRAKRPRLEEPMVEIVRPVVIKVRPVRSGDLQMFWDSEKLRTALVEKGTILLRLCTVEPQVGEEYDTPSDFVGVLMDSVEDMCVTGSTRLDMYSVAMDDGYGQYGYHPRGHEGGEDDFVETEAVEESLDYDAATASPDWQGGKHDSAAQRRAMPPPPPPPPYYPGHSPLSPPLLPRAKRKHGMRGRPPLHRREAYSVHHYSPSTIHYPPPPSSPHYYPPQHNQSPPSAHYYSPNSQYPASATASMSPHGSSNSSHSGARVSGVLHGKQSSDAHASSGLTFRPPTPPPIDSSGSQCGALRQCSSLLSVKRPAPGSILSVQLKLQYKDQDESYEAKPKSKIKAKTSNGLKNKNPPLPKNEKLFCDFCTSRFRKRTALIAHVKHKHKLMKKCPICNVGVKVKGQYNMKFHILKAHKDVNAFACGDCGAVFRLQHHLKNHLKIGCIPLTATEPELKENEQEKSPELAADDNLVSEKDSSSAMMENCGIQDDNVHSDTSDTENSMTSPQSPNGHGIRPKPGKRKNLLLNDPESDKYDRKKGNTSKPKLTKSDSKIFAPGGKKSISFDNESDVNRKNNANKEDSNLQDKSEKTVSDIYTNGRVNLTAKLTNKYCKNNDHDLDGRISSSMLKLDSISKNVTQNSHDSNESLKVKSKLRSDEDNYETLTESTVFSKGLMGGNFNASVHLANVCVVIDNIVKLGSTIVSPHEHSNSPEQNDACLYQQNKNRQVCDKVKPDNGSRLDPLNDDSDDSDSDSDASEREIIRPKPKRGRVGRKPNLANARRRGRKAANSSKRRDSKTSVSDNEQSESDDDSAVNKYVYDATSSDKISNDNRKKRVRSIESDDESDEEPKKKQPKTTRRTRGSRKGKSWSVSDSECSSDDEKKYACENCDAEFKDEVELRNHEKEFLLRGLLICKSAESSDDEDESDSNTKKGLTCPKCDRTCSNAYLLRKHMDTHIQMVDTPQVMKSEQNLSNDNGDDSLESRLQSNDLSSYIVKSGKMYTCRKCNLSFKLVSSVTYHMKKVHETLYPFKACEYCGKIFRSCGPYYKHLKGHQGKTCPVDGCKRRFRNLMKMRQHHKKTHPDYPHRCSGCFMIYKYKDEFDEHFKKEHPELLQKLDEQAAKSKLEEQDDEDEEDDDQDEDEEVKEKKREPSLLEKMDIENLPDKRKTRTEKSYNEDEECAEFIAIREAAVKVPVKKSLLTEVGFVQPYRKFGTKRGKLLSGRGRGGSSSREVERLKRTEFEIFMPTGELERGSRRKTIEEPEKIEKPKKPVKVEKIKVEKMKVEKISSPTIKPIKVSKKKVDRSWTAALKARMKAEARAEKAINKNEGTTPSKASKAKAAKLLSDPIKAPSPSEIIANDNLAALVVRRVAETLASQQVADLKVVSPPSTTPHLHHPNYQGYPAYAPYYGPPPHHPGYPPYHHPYPPTPHYFQQHHHHHRPAASPFPHSEDSSSSMDNSSHSTDRAGSPAKELRFDNF